MLPGAESDIIVNGHREGIRLLKDHPDLFSQRYNIDSWSVNRVAVDFYFPFHPCARNQIIHPVEDSEE